MRSTLFFVASATKKMLVKQTPWANAINLFVRDLTIFVTCVPGKPFQPSLMFVGKARSLP